MGKRFGSKKRKKMQRGDVRIIFFLIWYRQQEEEIINMPFAVRHDDPVLDKHYKSIERWGDPMAHLKVTNLELELGW